MAAADVVPPDSDSAISPSQPNTMKMRKTSTQSPDGADNALESLDLRADPDAQATVTDYLDFTEYLPSDMMRSLTLIGKLDSTYVDASTKVHELTEQWGRLPAMPPIERPNAVALRAEVSENLNHAVESRVSAHAEASRMAENVNRHYNRAKTIFAKLQTMLKNYPTDEEMQRSPIAPRSPLQARGAKITQRVDGAGQRPRRQRVPRITVPGEVLAPYELDYETYSEESESSSEESDDESTQPRATPGFHPRIKLVKGGRPPKLLKVPRPRRSSMSTSFVLSQLRKPPENAVIGSADAPWLQLTPYELAMLRKRMKKNAAWAPSDTMIARELRALGRGPEAYKAARKKAEEEGRLFDGTVPAPVLDSESGIEFLPPGALGADVLNADGSFRNRGMKLNEAKKMKRESLAKLAAEEAEESARKMRQMAQVLLRGSGREQTSRSGTRLQPKKRKRDFALEFDDDQMESPSRSAPGPQFKRTKTETPVPPPHRTLNQTPSHSQEKAVPPRQLTPGGTVIIAQSNTPVPVPVPSHEKSIVAVRKPSSSSPLSSEDGPSSSAVSAVTTIVPLKPPADRGMSAPILSPRSANTPSAPFGRETRKREVKKEPKEGQGMSIRASSRPATPAGSTPGPDFQMGRRPASRGKAPSQEPQSSIGADRPRRASTARNTPAPENRPPSRSKQRAKRPAPGVISRTNSGGSSAVGKRKAAPRKKKEKAAGRGTAVKKEKGELEAEMTASTDPDAEVEVEVDDEGKVIDADEPRYCLCNRVSFGTMIQCDNVDNCKQEWFHLDCVGLKDIPARTTKWYCPDCRKALNIGEKGEVSARGVRA